MIQYSLMSGPMICAPGILRWAMNGYHFKRDRKKLLNVFVQGWGQDENSPSADVFDRLLKGEIPYTVEDDEYGGSVVFKA